MKKKEKSDELNELREYFRQAVDERNLDTEDIANFSKLIEKVNNSVNDKDSIPSTSPDELLKRIEARINFDDRSPMKMKSGKRFGILIAAAILVSCLISGQVVAAYHGTNLIDFVKEKISGLSYTISSSVPNDFADENDFAEMKEKAVYTNPNTNEVQDVFDGSVLKLEYIPDGFIKQSSKGSVFSDERMFFERYINEDKYLIFMAEKVDIDGILSVQKQGRLIEQGRKIGKYLVDLSNNDDSLLAMFENKKIFYRVESNLPLAEIEKIIENLK